MNGNKKNPLGVAEGIISWLESLIATEDPTSCRITITIDGEVKRKYEIPKDAYLRDYPEAVREAMNIIIRYKKAYGKKETKEQLEKAPNLYSELVIAGKGKVLEYILRNNNAA